jgi:hypothetical protein
MVVHNSASDLQWLQTKAKVTAMCSQHAVCPAPARGIRKATPELLLLLLHLLQQPACELLVLCAAAFRQRLETITRPQLLRAQSNSS